MSQIKKIPLKNADKQYLIVDSLGRTVIKCIKIIENQLNDSWGIDAKCERSGKEGSYSYWLDIEVCPLKGWLVKRPNTNEVLWRYRIILDDDFDFLGGHPVVRMTLKNKNKLRSKNMTYALKRSGFTIKIS